MRKQWFLAQHFPFTSFERADRTCEAAAAAAAISPSTRRTYGNDDATVFVRELSPQKERRGEKKKVTLDGTSYNDRNTDDKNEKKKRKEREGGTRRRWTRVSVKETGKRVTMGQTSKRKRRRELKWSGENQGGKTMWVIRFIRSLSRSLLIMVG